MKRVDTIDFTRGLVMIIMALDHVRDLMHTTSLISKSSGLNTTTTGIFSDTLDHASLRTNFRFPIRNISFYFSEK